LATFGQFLLLFGDFLTNTSGHPANTVQFTALALLPVQRSFYKCFCHLCTDVFSTKTQNSKAYYTSHKQLHCNVSTPVGIRTHDDFTTVVFGFQGYYKGITSG
jgi:hypothetical protein